jgi:hypothetical protein
MTTSKTTTTISPAEEVAANVSSPDIAEATVREANMSMMIKRITIARGVLMIAIIEPKFLTPY